MVHITQTTKPQSAKNIVRFWHLIDMKDAVLGRKIPEIAKLLQGKHKVNYVPYLDAGDFVVVINAKDAKVTGKKVETSTYQYYSGYPSGRKEVSHDKMMNKNPKEVVRYAVAGMLPKNTLRDKRLARLYIYADDVHPYHDKFMKKKA